jgi:hypothetical protein
VPEIKERGGMNERNIKKRKRERKKGMKSVCSIPTFFWFVKEGVVLALSIQQASGDFLTFVDFESRLSLFKKGYFLAPFFQRSRAFLSDSFGFCLILVLFSGNVFLSI